MVGNAGRCGWHCALACFCAAVPLQACSVCTCQCPELASPCRAACVGVCCPQVPQDVLPVVAAAVLLIAAQQSSGGPDDAAKLARSAGPIADAFGVEAQSVLDMAWQLRQVLQNDTVAISAMRCLKVYMERMGCG